MDPNEKAIKIETLSLALKDIDSIIQTMKRNNYDAAEVNDFIKKRWNIWNELYQVKKQ